MMAARMIADSVCGMPRIWPDSSGRKMCITWSAGTVVISPVKPIEPGMLAVEAIGQPVADRAEDDAAAHGLAVAEVDVVGLVEHLGRQQLQLQRHRQPVAGQARPEADEAFAGVEHLAGDDRLLAVEIGQAVGVALVGPFEPGLHDLLADGGIGDQRRRLDAVADQRRDEGALAEAICGLLRAR
jgi:hypothetical protein